MNSVLSYFLLSVILGSTIAELRTTRRGSNADISGLWYNQHGSELYLEQSSHGQVKGEFRTAVELRCGSAGDEAKRVKGHVNGHLFHFAVYSKGSNALITFGGQHFDNCTHAHVFRNSSVEMLHASWIMTAEESCCQDSWRQNSFVPLAPPCVLVLLFLVTASVTESAKTFSSESSQAPADGNLRE